MASANPFDLLGDDDNDDPSQLIAAVQQQKIAAKKPAAPAPAPQAPARLPTKPLPPAQAVREAKTNSASARGGGGYVGGRGRGGRGGSNREFGNGYGDSFSGSGGREDGDTEKPTERGPYGGPRQPYRGGRRGGYGDGEAGGDSERPPRRVFERRSGSGRGNEIKRDGAGRGNWGTATDELIAQETEQVLNTEDKTLSSDKQPEQESPASETNKDSKDAAANVDEEKEQEDKEMTLEEYEKIREEKRKALLAMKADERKVDPKEFESMKQLSLKKGNDEIFIKLGSDKDSKKQKDIADREERAKKSVSIVEFLKPAEGGRQYSPRGRGRGRGRGSSRGGYGGSGYASSPAEVNIKIGDPGQFPTLGGK